MPSDGTPLDYETIYSLYGYEEAIKFLVAQAEDELKAGVSTVTVLIRFHTKASRLRRLEEADKRINTRNQNAKIKKTRSKD